LIKKRLSILALQENLDFFIHSYKVAKLQKITKIRQFINIIIENEGEMQNAKMRIGSDPGENTINIINTIKK
jgi:hypothetical protein